VGIVGNILYRFMDVAVLKNIIYNLPEVGFYFIGPTTSTSTSVDKEWIQQLSENSNVFFLGPKNSKELPTLFEGFNAFLIPYTGKKNLLELSNSHKVLEFLSTGKPIVCSYIHQYENEKDIISMAESNTELLQLMKEVISNYAKYTTDDLILRRKQFAYANSYGNQIKRIENILHHLN
jgi:glycosyltransferase involved in cell wall biosynthesis